LYQIPKARRRKLDYKAAEGIFVVYETTTKHYKVYDPSSSRLITVRDVVFYEDSGYWKKSPSLPGGTACPAIDRNLVFQESLPCVSGDDSEEDGGKLVEEHDSHGDGGGDIGHPMVQGTGIKKWYGAGEGRIDYGKNYGTRLPRRDRGAPDNHNQGLKKTIGIVTCKTTLFIFRG